MPYTIMRAVYSIHYTTATERGTMRFAGPDLESVLSHFACKFPSYRVELIERFSLRA